jgi:dolichol-phosphate mannosyltransferase
MLDGQKIAVVIPAFRVINKIGLVIKGMPDFVDFIIVVDDFCPDKSGEIVLAQNINGQKTTVIFHKKNQGVGGAMITGFRKAIELEADIVVKVDGDNQMDTNLMQGLLQLMFQHDSDFVKGNRFHDLNKLRKMPKMRLLGNSILSFIVKFVSGNWHIMDPTNGYFAIKMSTLRLIPIEKLSRRYFFEIDLLVNLNIVNAYIQDYAMPARYEDENSSLSIRKIVLHFPGLLLRRFIKRIFYKYFLYDFNMASVYSIIGIPMVLWAIIFGSFKWYHSWLTNIPTPTGTMMLVVLPLMLGIQFILQAIHIDIQANDRNTKRNGNQ